MQWKLYSDIYYLGASLSFPLLNNNVVRSRRLTNYFSEGRRKTSFRVTKRLIQELKKTPGCKGWKIPRCHDRECHQRISHCLIRNFGLEGAKKLRITSVDWHNRIKQLENIMGNQQDQPEEQ